MGSRFRTRWNILFITPATRIVFYNGFAYEGIFSFMISFSVGLTFAISDFNKWGGLRDSGAAF
jgi:hypothetical protein